MRNHKSVEVCQCSMHTDRWALLPRPCGSVVRSTKGADRGHGGCVSQGFYYFAKHSKPKNVEVHKRKKKELCIFFGLCIYMCATVGLHQVSGTRTNNKRKGKPFRMFSWSKGVSKQSKYHKQKGRVLFSLSWLQS